MRIKGLELAALTMALAAPGLVPAAGAQTIKPLSDEAVRSRADALIAQMTPEEKAAQITVYFGFANMAEGNVRNVKAGAGALLFITDPKEVNRFQKIAMEESRLKIPVIFAADVMHGMTTVFPVPIGMAASWDPDLVMRSQAIAAGEARAVGVAWTFGPNADIARDPRWGRIVETAGEDPYLASAMAVAQVRGFQGPVVGTPGRLISGPKHFAGYGASLGGRDFDEVNLSDSDLMNVYFPPFKAAIDAGAGNIMSAYMALNGVPAAGNRWLLTDVLRKQWGFKGWVVSDNGSAGALTTHGYAADQVDAAAKALGAGLDMEMTMGRSTFAKLPEALAKGLVTQQELDDAVRRVLEAKIRLGLFEKPYADEKRGPLAQATPANLEAARIAAERAAVLLRNEGGLLPLDRKTLKSVAVIGPLAEAGRDTLGSWTLMQNKPPVETIVQGIRAKLGTKVTVMFTPGVALGKRQSPSPVSMGEKITRTEPADDTTGLAESVAAAKASDVAILVLGEAQDMTGEIASRSTFDLPGRQQELLDAVVATGKPVVLLLMSGRPLDLKDTKARSIMQLWYPGSRGGSAAANLLFGDASPGGKLPFLWPRNAAQLPLYYGRLLTHSPGGASQRYFNELNAPVYPFGYGLSYSTFEYSNLKLDRTAIGPGEALNVSVDLRNTGSRVADDVAQLYIHQRSGTAARPVRELKGFRRVTLKPGEVKTLTFRLGPDELRYWNSIKRDWVIDEAKFDVGVGSDSTVKFGTTFDFKR